MQNSNKAKFKVLDTFAGAGGFSLGFSMAGCEIIGAIEIDKWAAETFAYNHPETLVLQKDITKLDDSELMSLFKHNKPDIILGGPPCQGYSICNKNAGDPKDPRNSMFKHFIRIGKLFNPSVIIMENVPNLLRAKTKSGLLVVDIIQKELEGLGYHVYKDIIEATDYGVPQIRKRLFIIASKIKLTNPFPMPEYYLPDDLLKSDKSKVVPTLWDAISDLPEIEARQGAEIMELTKASKNDYQRLLRENSKKVYNHVAMKHSKRLVERFSSMKCGDSTEDVKEKHKPFKRNGNGEISGKVYGQNNRRMHPDRPCHTIAASFYANFVHPYKNRNFTAREGARIQSFPDTYIFKGKPTVVSQKLLAREKRHHEKYLCQYAQIGNAVPPLMANAIAKNLIGQLMEANNVCTRR